MTRDFKSRIAEFYSTFFRLGYLPKPGLVGALAGGAVFFITAGLDLYIRFLLLTVMFAFAVPAATHTEKLLSRKDPKPVIIDEVIGVLIASFLIEFSLAGLMTALFLFLVFDRIKPWPADKLQDLPGGWGIILDDVVAGLYALAIIAIVLVI